MVSYLTCLGIDSDFTGAPNFTQLVFCYRIIRLLQVSVAWFLRKGDKILYMKRWVKLTQHPLRVPGCFFGFQVIRTGSVGMHLSVPGSQWPTGGFRSCWPRGSLKSFSEATITGKGSIPTEMNIWACCGSKIEECNMVPISCCWYMWFQFCSRSLCGERLHKRRSIRAISTWFNDLMF